MKKVLLIVLLLLVSQAAKAQNDFSDVQAVQMLKKFYTEYMTIVAGSSADGEKKCELLKQEYCTKKLLGNIPKLAEQSDADPIINAQDSRMDCVKNLTFVKNNKKPNAYIVSYFYIDEYAKKKETFTINLTVINQNRRYKIDSIW